MKRKGKITLLLLMVSMVFSLTACGSTNKSGNTTVQMPQNNTKSTVGKTSSDVESTGKMLVAYYSYSGNTEAVANKIAELTGADLAKIDRAEAYPKDFTDIAKSEIEEGQRPKITVSVDNVSDYDTIFVGYPIWYDEAPAMIATFLEKYDFTGKTIIPFCTSSSDKIASTLHIFDELCPDATIAEALTANNKEDIVPWIESLGVKVGTEDNNKSADNNASASNILITYFTVSMDEGVDAVGRASRVKTDQEVLGNTEYLAYLIRQQLGGDLFRIETIQEYPTDNMDGLLKMAYEEKQKNARPELATQVENLDNYDVIFIGYPNWNADLPMPVYTFLESVDLSGKTIVPFVVHGGSGFSDTISTIARLQPNATVITDGFSLGRDNVINSGTDVIKWASSLNLEK